MLKLQAKIFSRYLMDSKAVPLHIVIKFKRFATNYCAHSHFHRAAVNTGDLIKIWDWPNAQLLLTARYSRSVCKRLFGF